VFKVGDKSKRLPWITCLFGAVTLLISFLPASTLSLVQYDRDRILGGEIWRMFTGHLVHWGGSHLLWDLLVFLGCAGLLEYFRRSWLLGLFLVSSLTTSAGLLVFQSGMAYYRGLSAIDMSVFAALCFHAICCCILQEKKQMAICWAFVLLPCFLKPLMEFAMGGALFVSHFGEGIEASPLSYVFGILATLIFLCGTFAWRKLQNSFARSHSFPSHKISEISIF
jgi:rhomboid family GlyGly-CTERM serine protease